MFLTRVGMRLKPRGHAFSFLQQGAEFTGKLSFDGMVRIDGSFEGEITGSGTLIVGVGARVRGTVQCKNLIASGLITGEVEVQNRAELRAPARLIGKIRTPIFIIEEGVIFDGTCAMGELEQERPEELKEEPVRTISLAEKRMERTKEV